jgi:hypothetical protein
MLTFKNDLGAHFDTSSYSKSLVLRSLFLYGVQMVLLLYHHHLTCQFSVYYFRMPIKLFDKEKTTIAAVESPGILCFEGVSEDLQTRVYCGIWPIKCRRSLKPANQIISFERNLTV